MELEFTQQSYDTYIKKYIHVYIVLTTKQLIANCRHILMSPANITGVHSSRGLGVEKYAVITIMA